MGRYARIGSDGSTVVNIILWDGVAPYPEDGLHELGEDSPVGIGWARENDEWVAPPVVEDPPIGDE
jgi:hypothetical protein